MAEEQHDVHFESADAGASLTYPQQAGTVRKNGFLVIKGRPCKVRRGYGSCQAGASYSLLKAMFFTSYRTFMIRAIKRGRSILDALTASPNNDAGV